MKRIVAVFVMLLLVASSAFADNGTVINKLAFDVAVVNKSFSMQWGVLPQSQLMDAKIKASKMTDNIVNGFVKLIPDYKPADALKLFMKICNANGYQAFIAENEYNPGNFIVTANSAQGNIIELAVDETMDNASVTLTVGQALFHEKRSKDYNPNKPKEYKVEVSFNMIETVGFDISDKGRSPDGNLILSEIKGGSAMANLGALLGSDLYSVDNIDTKKCTAQELREYIKQAVKANKTITVVFMAEDGKQKSIDVKPK